MVSARGNNTVAARWVAPASARKRAYSAPHSAARRSRKSRTVIVPRTSIPFGRTRTAVISRFLPLISIPTLAPNATNFLKSPGLWSPGIVIPAKNLECWVLLEGQELHGGGYGAPQVRELPVLQEKACRRTEREDRIATDAQASECRTAPRSEVR